MRIRLLPLVVVVAALAAAVVTAWLYFEPSSLLKLLLQPPRMERIEMVGSEVDGTLIDLRGGWFNEGRPTELIIRSRRSPDGWDVARNIVIRNARLRGAIRIQGLGRNGEAPRVRESSVSEGHTTRAQAVAPRGIVLENLEIKADHRIPLYLEPGVTGVTVRNCRFTGWTIATAVYLDAESVDNVIEDCLFDLRAVREVIAVDGSARNLIAGNRFERADFGGIYLYRNCGEGGTVRHQTPRENRIERNTFNLSGLRPGSYGVWIGSRQGRRAYCEADAGYDFGGSSDNRDFADDNIVTGNIFVPSSPRAVRDDGAQNEIRDMP